MPGPVGPKVPPEQRHAAVLSVSGAGVCGLPDSGRLCPGGRFAGRPAQIAPYMVNMGRYRAMTMKPMTTPMTTVIMGSSMERALALACSTSLS